MRRLPLYPGGTPRAGIENVDPEPLDQDCTRCPLAENSRTVCMRPGGQKKDGPTLLYISDYPGRQEDIRGRPMVGPAGQLATTVIRRTWPGSFVFDNVLKCYPNKTKPTDKMLAACAPYARQVIKSTRPDRIILSGRVAIRSIMGRDVPPLSVRKGYGWLSDNTPVFLMMNPAAAARNRFIKEWYVEDLQWALTTDAARLRASMPWTALSQAIFVETAAEASAAIEVLSRAHLIGFDTETAGAMYEDMDILTTAISADHLDDVYVWDGVAMRDPAIREPLLNFLGTSRIPKVAHNEIFDRQAIHNVFNVDTAGMHGDTGVWAKIINPEVEKRLDYQQWVVGLGGGKAVSDTEMARVLKAARPRVRKGTPPLEIQDRLIAEFGRDRLYRATQVNQAKNPSEAKKYAYALFNADVRGRYCAIDALSTLRLAEHQEPLIFSSPERTTVWYDLMGPGQEAFMYMQRWGCPVNRDSVDLLSSTIQQRIDERVAKLKADFGEDFNPASTQQVARLLFKDLKLPLRDFTEKGAPKTDEKTLKKLSGHHWAVDALLELRSDEKLVSYPKGWPKYIREDGRFHPSYKIDGARSGRPSCSDPNLFNLPRADSPDAKPCRDCIQVDNSDTVIFARDLSQAELRALAALSNDEAMKQVFIDGFDFHARTAELIAPKMWGVDWKKISAAQKKAYRSLAKIVNFSLVYGKTTRTLAKEMGVSLDEAQGVVNAILGAFPDMHRWMKIKRKEVINDGGVWTEWPIGKRARWRPLYNVASREEGKKITAFNGAVNSPVQGYASDLCLAALINLVHWCRTQRPEIRVILTVYDSILFQVPRRFVPELYWISKKIMENFPLNGVPLVSDPEIMLSWGTPFSMRDDGSELYVIVGKDRNGDDVEEGIEEWLRNN